MINNISNILKSSLEKHSNSILLDNELILNISNTINHLNRYKIINESVKGDLNKLNNYDYYTEFNFEENEIKEGNLNIINVNNENNTKKKKSKLKEKYKNLMKKKGNEFMEKIKGEIEINASLEKEEKENKEDKDTIMCFYCRNPINLNSFEQPYGKLCFILGDLFKKYSQKSSIKSELNKISENNNEEKNIIYLNMIFDKTKD